MPEEQLVEQPQVQPLAATVQPREVTWPSEAPKEPCSWNTCAAGHKWPPTMQIAQCPGCGGPILIVKMQNCPVCNEPVRSFALRAEHCPQGGQITGTCQGQASLNEVDKIVLTRHHAEQEQANHVERPMISKP